MINPIKVFVTPKVLAKIGIAGIIRPKPIATKNEIEVRTATSRGNPPKGDLTLTLEILLRHLGEHSHVHGYLEGASL